jgi:hypothetical protein
MTDSSEVLPHIKLVVKSRRAKKGEALAHPNIQSLQHERGPSPAVVFFLR